MNLEQIVAKLVEMVEHRYYGKYQGTVIDNADTQHLGRLKLRVPSVLGDSVVTGWALPCLPYGGDMGQGFVFIPEVGAGVWVEFEHGDLEHPIWTGTFWGKPGGNSEMPKPNKADGTEEGAVQDPPTCKVIKTKAGHSIQFEDASGSERITILEKRHAHVITLDGTGIVIEDGINSNKIVMDGNGITLTTTQKIKLGSGAEEHMVLGDEFSQVLDQFIKTQLQAHQHVATSMGGPTSPPIKPFSLTVALSKKHVVE